MPCWDAWECLHRHLHLKRRHSMKILHKLPFQTSFPPKSLPVAAGARVKGFYVARVTMKRKQFNPKNVETLLHRIGQKNILLALSYGDVVRFALKYDEHVVVSWEWGLAEEFCFVFSGLNLDDVWNGMSPKKMKKMPAMQLDFNYIEKESLLNEIANCDILNMTPLDAMNTLYKLVKEAKRIEQEG